MTKKQFRKWVGIVVGCLLEQFKGRKLKKELVDLVCNIEYMEKK